MTATEVRIGVTYFANKDEANAAIGAPGVTSSDGKKNAQAVIDDINARGGVAGRKLVPIFHAFDSQSAETRDTQDRAACARFTEDNQVFAVAGSGVGDELAACLTKAGVIQVDSGVIIGPDRVFFSQHPDYVNIGTLTQDRMMAALVPTLVRMTYFSGWDVNAGGPGSAKPKVGVLSLDVPEWERPLTKVLLPALARAGHSVAPEHVFRAHNPASPAEFGDTFSGMQGATLRFSSDGVTHVIMLDPTGSLTMIFTTYAKNQRYYPRLGINSGSGMQSLVSGGVVEAKHFTGAVGLGWLPALDLPAADGDRYATGETKRCIKVIEERSGQTFTSTNAASGALAYCDQINLIAAAVNGAGRVINRSTGRTAIEALGSRFPAAGLPAAFLSANRHDAAELGFDLAWDEACPCARYRGEGRRIL